MQKRPKRSIDVTTIAIWKVGIGAVGIVRIEEVTKSLEQAPIRAELLRKLSYLKGLTLTTETASI